MKKKLLIVAMILVPTGIFAQGNNTSMGGYDGDYQSLAERLTKIEKKSDKFNVFFNYAYRFQESKIGENDWHSRFANNQLRLEIKGNLTDKISYRYRNRLNKSMAGKGLDNFAKATDIFMVSYQVTDKLNISGGKLCQIHGGFEFDENPMYIYQYSDMVDNIDNFMAGVVFSFKPIPSQELAFEVSDVDNDSFANIYGSNYKVASSDGKKTEDLEEANHPLTYIANWNGNFFENDLLQTRWSWGIQTQAKDKYSKMLYLGQKLNFPTLQWYFDYMGAFEELDRVGIVSRELGGFLPAGAEKFSDVKYNSFVTKVNWQFAPQWNLMLKGMYETASASKIEALKNYRKSFGYFASCEYYPAKSQDFRIFLAYLGRKFDFSEKSGLKDYNTNKIEIGFMYRIKAF